MPCKNKNLTVALVFIGIVTVGVISAYLVEWTIYLASGLIGLAVMGLFLNQRVLKRILPYFMLIILFQDTLARLIEIYVSADLGTLVSYLDEAFLVIALPGSILRLSKSKEINQPIIGIVLTIIIMTGMISSILHSAPISSFLFGAFLMIKGLLYLFVFLNIHYNNEDISYFLKTMKPIVFIVLFFAVIDLLFYETLRSLIGTDDSFEFRLGFINVKSLFIHPGIFGWLMVYIGAYFLSVYFIKRNIFYLLLTIILFTFGLFSFRYKVILSVLLIALIIYLLLGIRKVLTFSLPALFFFLLCFLLFGDVVTSLTSLTLERYVNIDMFDSARKALYIVSFLIGINEFPFGVGFGRYAGFIAREDYSPVYYEYGLNRVYGLTPEDPRWATDTYWPNIIGETGFIGAGCFLFLIIFLIIKLLKNYKNMEIDNEKIFVLFSGLILIQSLCESLAEPIYNSSPQNVFIFITTGIGLSLINSQKRKDFKNEG